MRFNHLKRREFVTLLGGAVVAWPLAARAQERMPRIGILSGASQAEYGRLIASFRDALREFGYVEDQNIAIEYNWLMVNTIDCPRWRQI